MEDAIFGVDARHGATGIFAEQLDPTVVETYDCTSLPSVYLLLHSAGGTFEYHNRSRIRAGRVVAEDERARRDGTSPRP